MIKIIIIILSLLFVNHTFGDEVKINERMMNFKYSKKAMEQIKESIIKDRFLHINDNALFLYNWFLVLPSYFPKGSESSISNNSDASSEIWENFDLFRKYSNNSKNITLSILRSLEKKDKKIVKLKFDELERSCRSCHKKFRN